MREVYSFNNDVQVSNQLNIKGRCYGASIAYIKNIFDNKEKIPVRSDIANLIQNQHIMKMGKPLEEIDKEMFPIYNLRKVGINEFKFLEDTLKEIYTKYQQNEFGVYQVKLLKEDKPGHVLTFHIAEAKNIMYFDANKGLFELDNLKSDLSEIYGQYALPKFSQLVSESILSKKNDIDWQNKYDKENKNFERVEIHHIKSNKLYFPTLVYEQIITKEEDYQFQDKTNR
ncbi:MAG: hypothetical protein EP298_01705 [Gammaproteobacteria bacterium]|nr:MAG: hypothetical protein EP298_01705 [Gammaproteobacteria bacterium]UTW43920.1 hypothetical protein KFE69_07475 [bacterium SCSIO 12844]